MRHGNNVRRWSRASALGVGLAVMAAGSAMVMAPAASAGEAWDVQIGQVCRETGHTTAMNLQPANPYGWFCVDVGVSLLGDASISDAGSLDVNAFCDRHYAGSHAEVKPSWRGDEWMCVR